MKKEIYALIKTLEQQHGVPVQVSVERPKETEQVLKRRLSENNFSYYEEGLWFIRIQSL
ncbi:MAG: hypothetical protein AABX31_02145 [Nanoarchaeota archaeon]